MIELVDGSYKAKILKDSISPDNVRLTTMEITFPRIILSELNTHRNTSKNSASSRARPIEKVIKDVLDNSFVPEYWGKNQKGMQAEQELSITEQTEAAKEWLDARDDAVRHARKLLEIGVHKQITNRLLEPFMYHTVICTATEWSNLLALRCHKDAQPEFRKIALLMKQIYNDNASNCDRLDYDDWHLPLILSEEISELKKTFPIEQIKLISTGRCTRVSYLTHHGVRDPLADIELATRIKNEGHMSPFEHIARPMNSENAEYKYGTRGNFFGDNKDPKKSFAGNLRGWVQFRKELPFEDDYSKISTTN